MPNTQTRISLGLKSAILIAVVFAVFHSDIDLIFTSALRNESSYYVAVIPFIIAYLVYSKRHMLRNVMALDTTRQSKNIKPLAPLAGISLSLVALLLYWRGSYALTPYGYHVLALPIFASGLTLILFNSETLKQLAFPIFFLLFLYPPPSTITSTFALTVMAAIFIILISRKIYQTRIISKKSMICSTPHPQTGRNYCKECGRILSPLPAKLSRMDVTKIVAIILIASLLTAVKVPETQHFVVDARRPLIVTTTLSNRQSNSSWMPTLNQYNLTFNYEDPTNETPHPPFLDLSLNYYYAPANQSTLQIQVGLQMASDPSKLIPYALSRSAWTQINRTKIIGAYYYVYHSSLPSEFQAVITWNTSLPVIQGQTIQLKYVELTLSIYNVTQNQLQAVGQQLVNLANMTMNYWKQTQPSSDITVIISEYSTALGAVTVAILIAIIFLYLIEARKRRKISLSAASKLNAFDAEIVKTIETTKQPVTFTQICASLQKSSKGRTLTAEQVEARLTELEDVGFIKRQIVSRNDVPIQTWKI